MLKVQVKMLLKMMMNMNGKRMKIKIMRKYINALSVLAVCLTLSCTERETIIEPALEGIPITLNASLENGDLTKTTLDGELGDPIRKIMWSPDDTIHVTGLSMGMDGKYSATSSFFTNISKEPSTITTFTGTISEASKYYALYPYREDVSIWSGEIWNDNTQQWNFSYSLGFNLPNVQQYRHESFAPGSFPMVAQQNEEGTLEFKNLLGVMVINMTGQDAIRSIRFTAKTESGKNATLCGPCVIPFDTLGKEIGYFRFDSSTNANSPSYATDAITLDCGEEGVALDSETPTRFYFALPPATYYGFTVAISTTDGRTMYKQGKNNLTIKRSNVSKSGVLEYMENVSVDLSTRGTSNCYIVSEPGYYSFDATVIGNGAEGIIPNAGFHTHTPTIAPSTAEILWQDYTTIVTDVNLTPEGRVTFAATGSEGNALISVKDTSGIILWSWHIWSTDEPVDHKYINHYGQKITVQDRNLGAISAVRGTGDQWRESVGLKYQWGRKDPFAIGSSPTRNDDDLTLNHSIQNPTVYKEKYMWTNNEWTHTWMDPMVTKAWNDTTKTIYDPCPSGYKVAPSWTWNGFTTTGNEVWNGTYSDWNKEGDFDYGLYFKYDGTNLAWYPVTASIHGYSNDNNSAHIWSSLMNDNRANAKYFSFNSFDPRITFPANVSASTSDFKSVRCAKDERYIDPSLAAVTLADVTDITTTSVNLNGTITSTGLAEVTAKGFVWSTSEEPTLENGTSIDLGGGTGEFTYTITDLTPFTTYYIRAYATNSQGTAYSREITFTTKFDGRITDLSANGTANCYMVSPEAGHYEFDATVIGNGKAGILDNTFHTQNPNISPASAEVLWEFQYNKLQRFGDAYYPMKETKSIISFIEYYKESGKVHIVTTGEKGNALIAVKDANGNILWSWHIWCTEAPEEQNYIVTLPKGDGSDYQIEYIALDRNIGATRADRGTEEHDWLEAVGFAYQWGRKDPLYDGCSRHYNTSVNMEYTISHPTEFIEYHDWMSPLIPNAWSPESKSIYDPCPQGYRVPPSELWTSMTVVSGTPDKGYDYKTDGTNSSYYPYTISGNWSLSVSSDYGYYWASDRGNMLEVRYYNSAPYIHSRNISYGQAVRCIKEMRKGSESDNEDIKDGDIYEW